MIYVSLKVSDENSGIDFYVNKLGLFKHIGGGRLRCLQHDHLIIDLIESSTVDRGELGIYFINGLKILDNLKRNKIRYKMSSGISGSCISITDKDGHAISLMTDYYEVC